MVFLAELPFKDGMFFWKMQPQPDIKSVGSLVFRICGCHEQVYIPIKAVLSLNFGPFCHFFIFLPNGTMLEVM